MAERPPAFEQFFAMHRFQPALAFAPNGESILFVTDISGQFNLWRLPAGGGWPEQLTTFEERSVRSVATSPDGRLVVFTADADGDEFHQIYAAPAAGGWPEPWTSAPRVQHFVLEGAWAPDGRRLAFAANSRDPADMDVFVRDRASGDVAQVFGGGTYALPASWSPDGERLLVFEARTPLHTRLHVVDFDSGRARPARIGEGESKTSPGPWTGDGSGFYFVSDAGREFAALGLYDLRGDRFELVETPDADVEEVAGSPDGRLLAWVVNEGGWSRLHIKDLRSDRVLPEPRLPRGCVPPIGSALTFSPDGRYAALLWTSPTRTSELYLVEVATGESRPLTSSMLGGLAEDELVEPQEAAFRSFDGENVHCLLYRPRSERAAPAVLSIHGGPWSQERPLYAPLHQYLASRGIAVLAPNIRGSTGYGRRYSELLTRDWGGGDLRDFEHAARWLREQPWVDEGRLGVFGGSYGGFATLTCVTRLPDLWRAAVDIVGPSNLETFVRAVPPSWRRFTNELIGDPDSDAAFLRERSPITYVENTRTPLLVIQGANDPRVVRGESDQMVERLRELGREVEYVVFDDEGHGFTKRPNQIRAFRLAADWFERHLLTESAA